MILGDEADLGLIRALAALLRQDGGEVRCYLEDDDYEVRDIGCKVAVGRLDDWGSIEGALTGVHTFIPILPDPAAALDEGGLDQVIRRADAATQAGSAAGIQQTILPINGAERSDTAIGRTYSEASGLFRQRCSPLAQIRTGFIWAEGRPFTTLIGATEVANLPAGAEAQLVPQQSLAELLAAVDDRERIEGEWDFGGSLYPLKEIAGAGPETIPAMLAELLSAEWVVGNEAEEEFGVKVAQIPQMKAS